MLARTGSVATLFALVFAVGCGGNSSEPKTPAETTSGSQPSDPTMSHAGTNSGTPSMAANGPTATATGGTTDSAGANSASSGAPPTAGSMGSTSGSSGAGTAGGSAGGNSSAAPTDEQILAITWAANTGEVDQGKLAQQRAKNAKVKAFAAMMVTDHTMANSKQKDLQKKSNLTPQESPWSQQLTTDATTILGNLKSAGATDFDKQYIDAQVKEHQQVLDTLDNQLLPNAKNADLKTTLQAVREKVAGHLKQAQEIQASLK